MSELIFTGVLDRKGIPIAVGDLIRLRHFRGARNRQVYMYKRIMFDPGSEFWQIYLSDLENTHKCRIEAKDGKDDRLEVIDGRSIHHPSEGWLVCWWERKRLKKMGRTKRCGGSIVIRSQGQHLRTVRRIDRVL